MDAEVTVPLKFDGTIIGRARVTQYGYLTLEVDQGFVSQKIADLIKGYSLREFTIDSMQRQPALPQSNLVDHAKRELNLLGEDPETTEGYLKVIRAFADMGHSGGSASVAIPVINELLQYHNLRSLTDDPREWMQVEMGDQACWQNRRRSEAFSNDGGKTYYLLSEAFDTENNQGRQMHTSTVTQLE